jgi:hypothetical protein
VKLRTKQANKTDKGKATINEQLKTVCAIPKLRQLKIGDTAQQDSQ